MRAGLVVSLLLASACAKDWSEVDLERTECVAGGYRVQISAPRGFRAKQLPEGCLWNEDISGENFATIAVTTRRATSLQDRIVLQNLNFTADDVRRKEALSGGGHLVAWHDHDDPTHQVILARPSGDPDVDVNCEAVVATRKNPAAALAWLVEICESMKVLPARK